MSHLYSLLWVVFAFTNVFFFILFFTGGWRDEKETQRCGDLPPLENLKIQLFLPKCNKLPAAG